MSAPTEPGVSAFDVQEGGDHYKKLGDYQPWKVAAAWLTPEELKGAAKFTAFTYLAREADKGGMGDIRKAAHTLQIYLELEARRTKAQQPEAEGCTGECADCKRDDAGTEAAPKTQQYARMKFDPAIGGAFVPADAQFAEQFRAWNGAVAWLYNPWTGQPRDPRDIGSDVLGHLITPQ